MPPKRQKSKKNAGPLYLVEAILGKRQKQGTSARKGRVNYEYLIKWLHYPKTANTWEPYNLIKNLDILPAFEAQWQQDQLVARPAQISARMTVDPNVQPERAADRGNQSQNPVEPMVETRAETIARELLKCPQVLFYDLKALCPEFGRLPVHIWNTSAFSKVIVVITDSPEIDENMPPRSFVCSKELHEGWAMVYAKADGRELARYFRQELLNFESLSDVVAEIALFGSESALVLLSQQDYDQHAYLATEATIIV